MEKIISVSGEDWQGFYKDGKLIIEGHRVSARELIEALGFTVVPIYLDDGDHLDKFGNRLPLYYSDLEGYLKSSDL